MKKDPSHLLLLYIFTFSTFLTALASGQTTIEKSLLPNCGVVSVIAFMRVAGLKPTHEEENRLFKTYPQPEVSMAQVQEMARLNGIEMTGVKATLSDLKDLRRPFIIHLTKPDHFVAVDAVTSDGLRVMESTGYGFLNRKEVQKRFQGLSLIPQDALMDNGSTSLCLTVDALDYNAGPVEPRRLLSHVFNLKNRGIKPITVSVRDVSCGCTTVTLGHAVDDTKALIAPGEALDVRVEYSAVTTGNLLQYVTLATSDERSPVLTLSLRGYVSESTRVSVDSIRIITSKGVGATRSFIVSSSPTTELKNVQSGDSHIRVGYKVQGITSKDRRWQVKVGQADNMPVGNSDSLISIFTSDPSRPVITIHVKSTVNGDLEVSPAQIFLGFVRQGSSFDVNVQVLSRTRTPFLIYPIRVQTGSGRNRVSQVSLPKIYSDNGYVKSFTIHIIPRGEGIVNNTIVFSTNVVGEKEVSLPVSFSVESAEQSAPTMQSSNPQQRFPLSPRIETALELPRAEDTPRTKIGKPIPLIHVGMPAPEFKVLDCQGKPWRLDELRGKNVLLTFFPKCFTGGCATQLSSLRDHQSDFDAAQTQILAVSVDPAEGDKGQLAFAKQWGFQFPLIPDTKRILGKQFGAIQNDDERAARLSFLIDKQGIVRWIDTDVHVDIHGADVLAKIKELGLDR